MAVGSAAQCSWSQTPTTITLLVAGGAAGGTELVVRLQRAEDDSSLGALLVVDPATAAGAGEQGRVLAIPLHAAVIEESLRHAAGAGGLCITLQKAASGSWPRLTHLKRDPAYVRVDWSKFRSGGDEDEEEDYDTYLKTRYGVTSDWRGPCSGDPPPVLGGRRPGETYPQDGMITEELPCEEIPDDGGSEAPCSDEGGRKPRGPCTRWTLIIFRGFEVVAWLMPAVVLATNMVFGFELRVEGTIYPIVYVLAVAMGLVDVVLAVCGASRAEGPPKTVLLCWLKRCFLCMTFLAFEASFGGGRSLFADVRPGSGLAMVAWWTVRKLACFIEDIRGALLRVGGASGEDRLADALASLWPQWRLALFLAEAAAEAVCLVAHAALLPRGVAFLGIEDDDEGRQAFWAALAVLILGGNALAAAALWRLGAGSTRQCGEDAVAKKEQ